MNNDTKVIIIHWTSNFICYEDILSIYKDTGCTILVSLMDMAPFTGGCHYSYGCKNYQKSCITCPATSHVKYTKLIHSKSLKKASTIKQLNASALGMNQYVLNQAKSSSLPFKNYYGLEAPIDQSIFKYSEEFRADDTRQPKLLIGAFNPSDKRKGFNTLVSALSLLAKRLTDKNLRLTIMVLSNTDTSPLVASCYDFYKFDYAKTPESLAKLYHQADLFVNTSLDDSGPLMISEAIFCGVPFIATNVGITGELINFDSNLGYSVPILDPDSLADKLFNVLFSPTESKLIPSNERAVSARNYYSQFESLEQLMIKLVGRQIN
jgi:glycosyltransferase involved in cell wall biosynthesis